MSRLFPSNEPNFDRFIMMEQPDGCWYVACIKMGFKTQQTALDFVHVVLGEDMFEIQWDDGTRQHYSVEQGDDLLELEDQELRMTDIPEYIYKAFEQ